LRELYGAAGRAPAAVEADNALAAPIGHGVRGALVALGAHAEVDVEKLPVRQISNVARFVVPTRQGLLHRTMRAAHAGLGAQQEGIDALADAEQQDEFTGLRRFERWRQA
jgi:hypothetical protein